MKNERTYPTRLIKGTVVTVLLVLVLVASARMALRSNWLFDRLQPLIVQQIEKQIEGFISAEALRGDLLGEIEIHNLLLEDRDRERVLQAERVRLRYNIRELIREPRIIRSIEIDGADLVLSISESGEWNLLSLYTFEEPQSDAPVLLWEVEELILGRSSLHLLSHNVPDGRVSVTQIEAALSAGQRPEGFFTKLTHLGLTIEQKRLRDAAEFSMSGEVDGDRITLEKLILETNHTLFTATASLFPESAEATLLLNPLSHLDLALYLDELPLEEDLTVALEISGTPQLLDIELSVDAPGIHAAVLGATIDARTDPKLTGLTLSVEELNLPLLTGLPDAPRTDRIEFQATGTIPFNNPTAGEAQLTGTIQDLRAGTLSLKRIESEWWLTEMQVKTNTTLYKSGEQIHLEAIADATITEPEASWRAVIRSASLNAGLWLDQPQFESDLQFRATLQGSGFDPELFHAEADFLFSESRIGDEIFSKLHFAGSLDPDFIEGFITAHFGESVLESSITLQNWQQVPSYRFTASVEEFNLSQLSGIEQFPTQIRGTLEGSGSGMDLSSLELNALLSFDESIINGERIDSLSASIQIRNGFLYIEEGLLVSPIAEARFSLLQHLDDFTHPDNRLIFESDLLDLSALAPVAGVTTLQAQGRVNGQTGRSSEGLLLFHGDLDLTEIQADTLFKTDVLRGQWNILLTDLPSGEISLFAEDPEIMALPLHDIELSSRFKIEDQMPNGDYHLIIRGEGSHRAEQKAAFSISPDESRITTNHLSFESPTRGLQLEKPFDFVFSGSSFRMDTLTIATQERSAFLSLWIPEADSRHQQAGLQVKNIRIDELQSTFMKEPLVRGLLSGEADFRQSPDHRHATSLFNLREIGLHDGEMDSLQVRVAINGEELRATLNSWNGSQHLLEGTFRVPLPPQNGSMDSPHPSEMPFEGHFQLRESELSYWFSLLPEEWRSDNSGKLSGNLNLTGSAASPSLKGNITLSEALISGLSVDRIHTDFSYLHEESELDLKGEIAKMGQQVAELQSRIPLVLNPAEGSWTLPGDEDELMATLSTNGFELSILGGYLDQELFRNLSGTLNGALQLSGPLSALQPEGEFNLTGGTLRVVPAAITLRQIRSSIRFERDRITIADVAMNSGPGTLTGSGQIELNGFSPGNIRADLTGRQFRLMNTPQTNAIVNSSLSLSGTLEEPKLNGSLTFLSGFYQLQDFGERTIEEVILEDEVVQEGVAIDFYDLLEMELAVRFNRQFLIRNRQYLDLEIELEGELDILKNRHEELQLFGTLQGARGYMRPLGRLFTLDEAVVSFFGPADDPQLQVRTSYEPPQAVDITIFYIVEGTLQQPEFRFESEPYLPSQDMISYTLFGRPFYELDSWKQVVTGPGSGPTPTGIAMDLILDRVEALASQNLGIDVVQIDNTRSGSSNTTTIKTGWYLNRRTFFAILNEVGGSRPKTLFMVEYLLRDNLELILTQGDDSREGVDLRWRLDY